MNTDKIREAIAKAFGGWDNCDCTEKVILDNVMNIITPYLARGITEAEAREWFNTFFPPYLLTDDKRLELIKYAVQQAHNLGLIVEPGQSEPVEQQPDAGKVENIAWCINELESIRQDREIWKDTFEHIDKAEEELSAIKKNSEENEGYPGIAYDLLELQSKIAALEAENAKLRQVPKESEELVKVREYYRGLPNHSNMGTAVIYIRELEAWKKQVEERT